MYCPRCGKGTVATKQVESIEHYYSNNYWKKSTHQCSECLASFINFDNGGEARRKKAEQEERDAAEYERLKAKFEGE